MAQAFLSEVQIRVRLLKKSAYRIWKTFVLKKGAAMIGNIHYDSDPHIFSKMPVIILSTFTKPEDFLILSYLFRDKELTFIAPENLPNDKIVRWVGMVNHVFHWRSAKSQYSLFRKLFMILRDYNRSVVISPEAAGQFEISLAMGPSTLVRTAMKTSVPVVPVVLEWPSQTSRCDVRIGKALFVSPRAEEFRDIFFKRRGARKFEKLSGEDLEEIGIRILDKIKKRALSGSDL